MIRVAAVGDLHVSADSAGLWRDALAPVSTSADLLLIAGDLTRSGSRADAEALLVALDPIEIPTVAVLGNHDYHERQESHLVAVLERHGVDVLEGCGVIHEVGGMAVGVAGTKGFGGGFEGASGSEFGEPEMKAFVRHTRELASGLERALAVLTTDLRIALLHYSPIAATLAGERLEIYPFLGSYLLGEAIDRAGADLVVHGHAHAGSARGATAAGVCVRNVAQPVIQSAYALFCLDDEIAARRTAAESSLEGVA
jgi:Icc-related predicted phosphoesterase